jgi:hypothetical protein
MAQIQTGGHHLLPFLFNRCFRSLLLKPIFSCRFYVPRLNYQHTEVSSGCGSPLALCQIRLFGPLSLQATMLLSVRFYRLWQFSFLPLVQIDAIILTTLFALTVHCMMRRAVPSTCKYSLQLESLRVIDMMWDSDEGSATETPDRQTYLFTEPNVHSSSHGHGAIHQQDDPPTPCENAMPRPSDPDYRTGTTADVPSSQVSPVFEGVPSRVDMTPVLESSDTSLSSPRNLDSYIKKPDSYIAFCPLRRAIEGDQPLHTPCGQPFLVSSDDKPNSQFRQHVHKHHQVPEIARPRTTRKARENRSVNH